MSSVFDDLREFRRTNYLSAQPEGASVLQDLDEFRNREGSYSTMPQQNETELQRALRELGTPDWLNDYALEPFLRFEGNLGIGFWDTFARK